MTAGRSQPVPHCRTAHNSPDRSTLDELYESIPPEPPPAMPAIITAPQTLLAFATDLQNRCRYELGFMPSQTYERAIANRRLRGQRFNDQLCGFLYHGPIKTSGHVKIYQAAVALDARRLKAATEMVARLLDDCRAAFVTSLSLRCAEDIDATLFWRSLGFHPVQIEIPAHTTGRRLIRYRLDLAPLLFEKAPAHAGPYQPPQITRPAINAVPRHPKK